jgi:hypothetical protein
MLRTLLIALAVMAVAVPAASAHYRKHGKACGSVVTTPNSDDGASAIRASRTSCRTARRVARRWERGNRSPLSFTCKSRAHDGAALSHRDVRCWRGEGYVSFAAY